MRRLERKATAKSHAYSSYTFGDPATPQSRAYLGDPVKRRVTHGGSELFHVYHLHGGGIRWRANPHADKTFDYQDTGLRKHPPTSQSPSSRLDSQSMGPGESYDLQMEGGAGGVQQVAGEFLWHCHIAEHYVAGMWTFWRTFDTRQPDLAPLPDRGAPPNAVDSTGLIGRTINGTTITRDNVDEWVKPQLPAQGAPADDEDATVWDYQVKDTGNGPLFLGAPEDRSAWADLRGGEHPGGMPGDEFVDGRPKIRFNPANGRPAFPLMRPQIGQRPPFSPNGHSGAPWLGERANAAPQSAVDPYANRPDGICPAGAPTKTYNVVAIEKPIKVTESGRSDPNGKIFVLAEDKEKVLAGETAEPLVIRGNEGDCVQLTLTSEFVDAKSSDLWSKVNMHVHHVQFDTQASDGVISGMSFEQSVRPYATENKTLQAAVTAGAREIQLNSVARLRPGIDFAVGLGTNDIEVNRIESIDAATGTVRLERSLQKDHASGEAAGVEFVQSRWYPDVLLDNVFWHDHVDGIHGWGHGLVGQIIVEPQGSTYHDPKDGSPLRSGAIADIHNDNASLIGDKVRGSFREFALFTLNQNPATDSTINLKAEPWSERLAPEPGQQPDPSLLFSSWKHGDPFTPTPKAYAGDPVVIRSMNVGPSSDTVRIDGHRFDQELRLPGTKKDTIVDGISERFSLSLEGGAGGPGQRTGDFLYHNGIQRRFKQGAWGLFRVFSKRKVNGLMPLPGRPVSEAVQAEDTPTGGRPPEAPDAGQPCPSGAPARHFDVSAVDAGGTPVFVPRTGDTATVPANPSPLVLHAAAGECVTVNLKNERAVPATGPSPRVSLNVSEVDRTARSSGVNAGFNPEQTVGVGESRTYRFHVDDAAIGSSVIADMGDASAPERGTYGALIVAPAGAQFRDPQTGQPRDVGDRIDVHLPSGSYRDMTVTVADTDPIIGGDFTPYKTAVEAPSSISHRSNSGRSVSAAMFSSRANGDPQTPLLTAYPGDPVRVHAIGAPGSEQMHVFSMGGLSWPVDPRIERSTQVSTLALGPWGTIDAHLTGGAGGLGREAGDYLYGDVRGPFTEAGLWGLLRVASDTSCPVRPLPGLDCIGRPSLITNEPQPEPAPQPRAEAPAPPAPQPPAPQPKAPSAPRPKLRNLRIPRTMSLAQLAKRGMVIKVTAPPNSRALEVVLGKVVGRTERTVLRSVVRLPGGGSIGVRWRPTRRQVAALRAGRYRLRVRAGSARSKLTADRLAANLRLTGKAPKAPARKQG
jgi:manganese oxidase